VDTAVHIRTGNPFDEIVDEARQYHVQLIILPTFERSFWKRLFAPVLPRVTENLAQRAPCPVYTIRVKKSFNCAEQWKLEPDVVADAGRNRMDGISSRPSRPPSFATGYSN
jgi:hypothetical protein